MTITIGQNENTNDEASMPAGIPINSSTATALITTTKDTIRVSMTNDGNQDVFLKFQSASIDNNKRSIILHKGTSADVMLAPNIFIGEISGIARAGNSTILIMSY